ncbi:hypothetical protein Pla52o_32800 [Novipirellula galeiformis]|uniref:Uncharacterized protein n=1 Tax=Novipirellula galeiformis TaxID=2528004 RepID=A0A5C6CFC7_9BACT|nr:hypothetical protein Pla52o_32800 [Novipirellula galeiformis]
MDFNDIFTEPMSLVSHLTIAINFWIIPYWGVVLVKASDFNVEGIQ